MKLKRPFTVSLRIFLKGWFTVSSKKLLLFAFLAGLVTLVTFQNCSVPKSKLYGSSSSSSGGSNNNGTTPGGTNPNPTNVPANEAFFLTSVKPVLQSRCASCHNEPRFVGSNAAPLTIYNYSQMRPKLAAGTGAIGNDLVRKVTNQVAHTGGNQCTMGATINDVVCGKLIEWWGKEFPTSAAGTAGELTYVSTNGTISGWALNPAAPATKVTVYFYRDNISTQGGVLIGSAVADQTGLGSYSGNYYNFVIPANLIDNGEHDIYVYLGAVAPANLLPGSPKRYGAYRQTAAGIAYWNANIQPTITSTCLACHAFNIDTGFANMLTPTPLEGGTPTNNNFIMNASGNMHPINACGGGLNSGLCAAIQGWYTQEFGP